MGTPTVSVIIPVYNREKHIANAIGSVLKQTYPDFELIISDDGSTDSTLKIVETFTDHRVRIIKSPINQGAAAARNQGIKQARGNLIAFLDSDDIWLPHALEHLIRTLAEHPEHIGVLANHYLIQNGITTLGVKSLRGVGIRHFLLGTDFNPGDGMLVKKEVFEKVGYQNPKFIRHEDWDWILRVYQAGYTFYLDLTPVAVINRTVYINSQVFKRVNELILAEHQDYFRTFGFADYHKAVSHRFILLAQQYLREGKKRLGISTFLRALGWWPFQRPGTLLMILDALLGTRFSLWAVRRRAVDLPPEAQHDG